MVAARRGSRPSAIKVTIRKAQKSMTFSTGFFRAHKISAENSKYIRLGYDTEKNVIGFEFLKTNDKSNEVLKLAYSKPGTSAACPINPVLISFDLAIDQIAGEYVENAIEGPKKIDGFSKNGFTLDVAKRNKK